jgi:hypothetical protein
LITVLEKKKDNASINIFGQRETNGNIKINIFLAKF